jgi:Mg2+-importing ATPase
MVVSLIPESLPAILSSNLQVGSKKMAKEKIVIKNFKAVQNLGSTTTIATDKTGTLTTGKLDLVSYLNPDFKTDLEVLKEAYLSVYFQNNLANHIDDSIHEL